MGVKMGFSDPEIQTEKEKKTLWLYRVPAYKFSAGLFLGTLTASAVVGGWAGYEIADMNIKSDSKSAIHTAQEKTATLVKEQNFTKKADALVLSDEYYKTSSNGGQVKIFTHVPYSKLIQEQKHIITENSKPTTHGTGTYILSGVGAVIGCAIAAKIIMNNLEDFYDNMGEGIHNMLHSRKKNTVSPK